MADRTFSSWPFFDDRHRELADELETWAGDNLGGIDHEDVDEACRDLGARLGEAGYLHHTALILKMPPAGSTSAASAYPRNTGAA